MGATREETRGYFAYGSNMLRARLGHRGRCPRATALGPAVLAGYRLRLDKRGKDGSGKCAVVPAAGEVVHGVLYDLVPEEREILHRVEGVGRGYLVAPVSVELLAGPLRAWTYVAEPSALVAGLAPFDWYLGLVVAGAREHQLPSAWVDRLAASPTVPDPDRDRARRILRGAGLG